MCAVVRHVPDAGAADRRAEGLADRRDASGGPHGRRHGGSRLLVRIPPGVYHGWRLRVGARRHGGQRARPGHTTSTEPDEYRLPPETDEIPYEWDEEERVSANVSDFSVRGGRPGCGHTPAADEAPGDRRRGLHRRATSSGTCCTEHPDDSDGQPRRAHLRRQSREPARRGARPALPLRPRRHLRRRRWCATSCAACDAVVHFAAETHVDRSILDADDFLRTNVIGTSRPARRPSREPRGAALPRTSAPTRCTDRSREGAAREADPLQPVQPLLGHPRPAATCWRCAYWTTHGCPVRDHAEQRTTSGPTSTRRRSIPLFVTNALEDKPLPLYGDGRQRARLALRARQLRGDRPRAAPGPGRRGLQRRRRQRGRERGADARRSCDLTRQAGDASSQPVTDRPGHDRRYALDCGKLRALGWAPRASASPPRSETTVALVPRHTRRGGSRSSRASSSAYYERQYGPRGEPGAWPHDAPAWWPRCVALLIAPVLGVAAPRVTRAAPRIRDDLRGSPPTSSASSRRWSVSASAPPRTAVGGAPRRRALRERGRLRPPRATRVTVSYVLLDAVSIEARTRDGRTVPAQVVGLDLESGLGVVKLEGGGPWPAASLGHSRDVARRRAHRHRGRRRGRQPRVGGQRAAGRSGASPPTGSTCSTALSWWRRAAPPGAAAPLVDAGGNVIAIASLRLGQPPHVNLAIPLEKFLRREGRADRHGPRGEPAARAPGWGSTRWTGDGGVVVDGFSPVGPRPRRRPPDGRPDRRRQRCSGDRAGGVLRAALAGARGRCGRALRRARAARGPGHPRALDRSPPALPHHEPLAADSPR